MHGANRAMYERAIVHAHYVARMQSEERRLGEYFDELLSDAERQAKSDDAFFGALDRMVAANSNDEKG